MDAQAYFRRDARISRAAIARYPDLDLDEVDDLADYLELPQRLTLGQYEELVEAFENEDENGDNKDGTSATKETPPKVGTEKNGPQWNHRGDNGHDNRSEDDS